MSIGLIISLVGVALAAIMAICKASSAWGSMEVNIKHINSTLDGLKPSIDKTSSMLTDIDKRLAVVEYSFRKTLTDEVAPANSPRNLNKRGESILESSGIKDVVEKEKSDLLNIIRARAPKNAYDAEAAILNVVSELLDRKPEYTEKLKEGAFRCGADIQTVLLVGGFHLRNLVFPSLGFTLDDIDKK